jgi:PPOX class probable F420-dependent enzyme
MITIPETHRDLLDTPVAELATLGPDGFPQVTALWFLFDSDGLLKLSLNSTRQKVKNLRQRPACTLFIRDCANPGRTLEIRARASIQPDPDYAFADKLGRKYGVDVRTFDQPGATRVTVTLEVVKVNYTR